MIFSISSVSAISYGIKYVPIENLDLKVEEVKKYHFYKEEKVEAYFLEGPKGFTKTKEYYWTPYSMWSKNEPEEKENREIREREVFKYQKELQVKSIKVEVLDSTESVLEFAFYIDSNHVEYTSTCENCSPDYSIYMNDKLYSKSFKIGKLNIDLHDYYYINSLTFDTKFNKENVHYKIFLYGSNGIIAEKEFVSTLANKTINPSDFDIKKLYEYEIETTEILELPVTDSYIEYSYRDKYFKYQMVNKVYYPTYEENVEGYIKDEDDFIVEKKYFYLEKAFIKDKIVINSEKYDLADYIKTSLPFEISSNIDISKNGNYKIKYIFDTKTIERMATINTNNEYINSLEDEIKKKKEEIIDITNDKNDLIERYESNLKSKDEIISKKQIENHIVKQNPIPIILITCGIMLIIFTLFRSFKNTLELKK